MINPNEYVNVNVPPDWLPETLTTKVWTFGELAQDRSTRWTGPDGKKFVMARQLLYIWRSTAPDKIANLPEDEQPSAIQRQHIAFAMLDIFPSQSEPKKPKEKKKSVPTVIPD